MKADKPDLQESSPFPNLLRGPVVLPTSGLPVRRRLTFGPPDPKADRAWEEMMQQHREAEKKRIREKWNFDVEADQPLPPKDTDRYKWEVTDDIPDFYKRTGPRNLNPPPPPPRPDPELSDEELSNTASNLVDVVEFQSPICKNNASGSSSSSAYSNTDTQSDANATADIFKSKAKRSCVDVPGDKMK